MALAYRTGFCVATLVAIFFSTVIHSQPNPYQRIEAPNPPLHLNDGRWGEMIQVRVGPRAMSMSSIGVLKLCWEILMLRPDIPMD